MLIKYLTATAGYGPAEQIVAIKTVDGTTEQVVVSERKIEGEYVKFGSALETTKESVLVELPRESASGKWRLWIPSSNVKDEQVAAE